MNNLQKLPCCLCPGAICPGKPGTLHPEASPCRLTHWDREQAPSSCADRIRAMDDAQLADLLLSLQEQDISEAWCNDPACKEQRDALGDAFDCTDAMLRGCVLRWLGEAAR